MLGYIIRSATSSKPPPATLASAAAFDAPPRDHPRFSRGRLTIFGLIASFASIIVVLLAVESGVRVWVAIAMPNIMVLDPSIGWRHRANLSRTYHTEGVPAHVRTYAHGLRTPPPASDDRRPRVLILGDSFVDGLEVSDRDHFVTRWAQARPDLALVNAGVGGYSTVQQEMWLDVLLPIVQPDRLVLVVDRSDLVDNIEPYFAGIGPRPYVTGTEDVKPLSWEPFRPLLLPLPGAEWLHANSVFAYLVRNRFVQSSWGARIQEAADVPNRRVPEAIKRQVLSRAIGRITARGIPTTVVATARKGPVSDQSPRFALEEAHVDLAAVLRPEHFYTQDIHWNAAGHAAVAARLSRLP